MRVGTTFDIQMLQLRRCLGRLWRNFGEEFRRKEGHPCGGLYWNPGVSNEKKTLASKRVVEDQVKFTFVGVGSHVRSRTELIVLFARTVQPRQTCALKLETGGQRTAD